VKQSQIKVITQSKKVKDLAPSVRRVCAFEEVTAPAGTGQARRALTCFFRVCPKGRNVAVQHRRCVIDQAFRPWFWSVSGVETDVW